MGKKSQLLCVYLVISLAILGFASGLEIRGTEEGSCDNLKTEVQGNINVTWLNSVQNAYVNAGNKFHMYRIILHHLGDDEERFQNLPEHTFYYQACISITTNFSADNFKIPVRALEPGTISYHDVKKVDHGIYDFFPISNSTSVPANVSAYLGVSRHYITLTDNRSFVFFTNCNSGADSKSWVIFSTTPRLSPEAIRQIEEHAVAQGFDKKNMVFLRYDSCSWGMNVGTETKPWGNWLGKDFGPPAHFGHHDRHSFGPRGHFGHHDRHSFGPTSHHGPRGVRGNFGPPHRHFQK